MASTGEPARGSTRPDATCPHPGLVRIEVIGSAFQFRWDRDTYVDATIAPDGTISGNAERITLAGRQADRKLEGDVTDGDCSLHFTVTRRSLTSGGVTSSAEGIPNIKHFQKGRFERCAVCPIASSSQILR